MIHVIMLEHRFQELCHERYITDTLSPMYGLYLGQLYLANCHQLPPFFLLCFVLYFISFLFCFG